MELHEEISSSSEYIAAAEPRAQQQFGHVTIFRYSENDLDLRKRSAGVTFAGARQPGTLAAVTVERRKPHEVPADPDITPELQEADEEARQEFAERGAELLERLRKL